MQCFICGGNNPPLATSYRIDSLLLASHERGDGLAQMLPENPTQFTCHRNCISTYCSKHHIERFLKRRMSDSETDTSTGKRRMRSDSTFEFRKSCIFCGEKCELERDSKHPKRWREAYLFRTLFEGKTTSKECIMKRADERNDEWGREVKCRINFPVSDLPAADARYHKDCHAKFFCNQPSQSSSQLPDSAFEELVKQMLSKPDKIWNSIGLKEEYIQLGGTQYTRRHLLKALTDRFGPKLIVLSSPGVASIVMFRDKASNQFQIIADSEDDVQSRAISSLANKIKAECPKSDNSTYATHLSLENALNECSKTLMSLLAAISPKLDETMPAAMIGNIITSLVNNQSTMLQVALSIFLGPNKSLIEQFNNFGITCTYNEYRRFKISAASEMAKAPHRFGNFDSTNGLVQVVADNFDTQISSQNGLKSTHGLAMIVTQAGQANSEESESEVQKIKRLKWEETHADQLSLQQLNIARFHGDRKPKMPEKYAMKIVPSLAHLAQTIVSHNRADEEDFSFLKQASGDEMIPEYSGFNVKQAREADKLPEPKTKLMYTPFLDMLPSEPDTIKTAMLEARRLTLLTGQQWTVFTTDQQLYKVVLRIIWQDPDAFPNFVPRLGGMHMLISFVGAIGTLMAGSGLEEILKSAFAGVPKMLTGKNFPQNVRALRILLEEMLRPVLRNQDIETMGQLKRYLELKATQSRTTKMWVECFINPLFIIMQFVRAEREGDWPLHLCAVEKMLPYFFASSHVNYARYGLLYLQSMQHLPPAIFRKFMTGQHVMRHQDGLWNAMWSDLFIETTYMRYGHGPSGIIGSTLNESTLAIWALSQSACARMRHDIEAMKTHGSHQLVTYHKEERYPRMVADNSDRKKIREAIATCIDVFDIDQHPTTGLVDLYSGRIVQDADLNVHSALDLGTAQMLDYESHLPGGFYAKLKKNVKTMAAAIKQTTRLGNSNYILDTEFIYARVIGLMASSRDTISIENLFSYELAPHPTSLFDESGQMRNTAKSILKTKMQVQCGIRNTEGPEVTIIDGCALLWTILWPASPAKISTFIEGVVADIQRRLNNVKILHIVFDRYYALSTKSSCRILRQKGFSRIFTLTEETPLPKQATVLNVSSNKEQLIRMIVSKLCSMSFPPGNHVIITGPDPRPIEIGVGPRQTEITHEEADVIMTHHMINEALKGHSRIRVVSDDTDVFLLLSYHLHMRTNNIPEDTQVSMEAVSGSRTVISINDVVKKHSKIISNILGAHALSGCDTVSSFFSIGKSTVFKKIYSYAENLSLGDLSAQVDEIIKSASSFTATLYGHAPVSSLSNMRTLTFTQKIAGKRNVPPILSSLPPTMAAFRPHCMRAHFQTAIWKAAGEPAPPNLNPLHYGWQKCGQYLRPTYTEPEQPAGPDEVLNLVKCGCNMNCSTRLCTCAKNSIPCTLFCKCQCQCQNPVRTFESDDFAQYE